MLLQRLDYTFIGFGGCQVPTTCFLCMKHRARTHISIAWQTMYPVNTHIASVMAPPLLLHDVHLGDLGQVQ